MFFLSLLDYIYAAEWICGNSPDISDDLYLDVYLLIGHPLLNLLLLNNLLLNFNTQCIPTLAVCVF